MTAPAPTQRLSSAELLTRLDVLEAMAYLRYRPSPLLIYKPSEREPAKGTALKVELRAIPSFSESGYLTKSETPGGLFLDLAAYTHTDDNDNARFNWNRDEHQGTPQQLITAKLGIPDLQRLLLGYQYMRLGSGILPSSLRAMRRVDGKWVPDPDGHTIGLTHKFNEATTIIDWQFSDRGSWFAVSKSRELRRSVSLTLEEELTFTTYLRMALERILETGLR